MAHIRKRKTAKGDTRYDVHWRVDGAFRQRTFRRSADANTFLREIERQELTGVAFDPKRSEMTLGEYAEEWLPARRKLDGSPLAPRTVEGYRAYLDRFILPELGRMELGEIRLTHVRAWHTRIADAVTPQQAAKAYRLLRTILNTAVEDERIIANPARIRGGGVEHSAERPFVDTEIVLQLADTIEHRYRALVLLAGFGGLRLGELLGLRRQDVLLESSQVRVEVQAVELKNGDRLVTAPKTLAGRRLVYLPGAVTDALAEHMRRYTGPGPDDVVFTGPLSEGLRRATFYTAWSRARTAIGQANIHLHDLRHAAGTLAAQQGATQRELMARLGHASPVAALRYQHAAERRDAVIADALQAVIEAARHPDEPPPRSQPNPSDSGVEGYWRDGGPDEPDYSDVQPSENAVPPGDLPRASDGNRTRVLSLGSPPRPSLPPGRFRRNGSLPGLSRPPADGEYRPILIRSRTDRARRALVEA
jgi:integrase